MKFVNEKRTLQEFLSASRADFVNEIENGRKDFSRQEDQAGRRANFVDEKIEGRRSSPPWPRP